MELRFAIALASILAFIVVVVLTRRNEQRRQNARRKAELIKLRLQETQQIRYPPVEIRLENRS